MLSKNQMANIRSYLQENFKLPSEGFIAGQAVASLVYKELNLDLNKPINDVDVFALIDSDYENFIKTQKKESEIGVLAGQGSFSDQIFCIGRRGYEVKLSIYLKEDKNVNMVYISQFNNEKVIDKNMLLNSFDFNCCSVGYDIETGLFVWSKSFEDFVKNKQLRVQSVHTPLHTLLRLNKKIEDLGGNIYCDKDVERDLLISSIAFFGGKISSSQIVGSRFLKLYYRYKDDFISNLITKRSIPEKYRSRPDYRRANVSAKKILDYIAKSPVKFKPLFDNVEISEPIYVEKISGKSLRKKRKQDFADYKTKNTSFDEIASMTHTSESVPLHCYQEDLSRMSEYEEKSDILAMFFQKVEYSNLNKERGVTSRIRSVSDETVRFANEISSEKIALEMEKKEFTNIPDGYELEQTSGVIGIKKTKDLLQLHCKGTLPRNFLSFNVNFQSFVHLYHAMKDTGVFDLKYSRGIMTSMLKAVDSHIFKTEDLTKIHYSEWFKRSINNHLIYTEYANDVTCNPLSKIGLNKKLKKYASISKLLNKHFLLTNVMKRNIKENESYLTTIEKLHVVAQKIKKDSRREFVIGLMETESATLDEVYNVINKDFEEMKEALFNLTPEAHKIAKKRQVTNGFNFKLKNFSLSLKQLVTIEDFFNAGQESNNCIMGYFSEYVNENKRTEQLTQYFRMELNGVVSNIQISNGRIHQHYNKKNSRISKNQKWIGLLIARYYAQTDEAREVSNKSLKDEIDRLDPENTSNENRLLQLVFLINNGYSKIKHGLEKFDFLCRKTLGVKQNPNSLYAKKEFAKDNLDDDIPF